MSYKIKLRAEGFELEIEGDREFVESKLSNLEWIDQIFNKFGSVEITTSKAAKALPKEKPAFNEFASLVKPKTNWEKFLTIAYYLYKWEDRDMTYEDVENYYRHARWPMPGNARDVMSNLIREGYMEDAGKKNDRKAFRILQKGIQYIEEALQRGEKS